MKKSSCFLFILAVVVFLPTLILGQSNVGSITGIVTDPSGAAIAAAEVTITNTNTGIVYRTRSNESGVYGAPSLLAGTYRVEFQMAGFKKHEVDSLVLDVAQTRRLDVLLEVGEVTEVVEVSAAVSPLMQESAEVSETITQNEIRNIPMNNRAPYGLLALSAGVSAVGDDPSDLDYAGGLSVNGSRKRSTSYVVDGASTVHIGGIGERIGSIESIQEFKVLASTYSAEYGRTSGGVVTFQVKSGTQKYHGAVYEYHRNSAFSAINWQNNALNLPQAKLIRNEFGGWAGGPIPGTGKKMFFFASYEGLRDRVPRDRIRTIPDLQMRRGDFSRSPVIVRDPLTSQPFPGNIIPQERLDPAAVKFLQLFPSPNTAGQFNPAVGISANNWYRTQGRSDPKNFLIARWDFNPNEKDKFFFTYSSVKEGPWDDVVDFENALNTINGPRRRHIRRGTFGYTRFVRPNLTNEFLAFGQRDPRKIIPTYPVFDVTKELGIQRKVGPNLPRITIAGGFGDFGESSLQDWVHQPAGLSNMMTWLKGRHNAKFGGQLYQNQFWYAAADQMSGQYTFNGEITSLGATNNNAVNALADLLLGAVKTARYVLPQIPVNRYNYNLGLFFQDDWKVNQRLTLNLGLRYEFETNQAIKNDIYSRVDLRTGGLLVAGRNASRNLDLKNDFANFSPRLGLAYSLNDKTVLRSGFAIFHSNIWVNNGERVPYPGFVSSRDFPSLGLGRAQSFTFTQGFPVDNIQAVSDPFQLLAAATPQSPLTVNSVTYNPGDPLPYSLQWNFGIQREVGFNTVIDVAYVASRGIHLSRTIPFNQPVLARASEVVINRVPLQQVRPYPVYSGFNAVFYDATSDYHSFQVKGTRRFSSGFSLDGNYTFSKNMDTFSNETDSMQIPWQFADIERGLSSLDRTHVLTIGSVYELPFGRNKPFLNGNAVLAAIFGGFQLNTIFATSSGLPLTIRQRNSNEILSAQRPDLNDGGDPSGRLKEPVFIGASRRWLIARTDPAFPFRPSSNLGIGTLARNTSREPGYSNFNISLFRRFQIKEGFNAEFRLEAFNAMNHVNFREPASTNIDDANYGLITAAAPARQIQLGLRLSF